MSHVRVPFMQEFRDSEGKSFNIHSYHTCTSFWPNEANFIDKRKVEGHECTLCKVNVIIFYSILEAKYSKSHKQLVSYFVASVLSSNLRSGEIFKNLF